MLLRLPCVYVVLRNSDAPGNHLWLKPLSSSGLRMLGNVMPSPQALGEANAY